MIVANVFSGILGIRHHGAPLEVFVKVIRVNACCWLPDYNSSGAIYMRIA